MSVAPPGVVAPGKVAGTHAPTGQALAMPFIEDEWWSAENEGRMVDLSNCLQVILIFNNILI